MVRLGYEPTKIAGAFLQGWLFEGEQHTHVYIYIYIVYIYIYIYIYMEMYGNVKEHHFLESFFFEALIICGHDYMLFGGSGSAKVV